MLGALLSDLTLDLVGLGTGKGIEQLHLFGLDSSAPLTVDLHVVESEVVCHFYALINTLSNFSIYFT